MDFRNVRAVFFWLGMLMSFTTMAHVNLKNPVGGETFDPGQSVEIEWEVVVQHDTKNWDLFFSVDGGKTYEPIRTDLDLKTLNYTWTVPYKSTKGGRIKIVQDNAGGNYSDESGIVNIAGISTASAESFGHMDITISPNPASDMVHLSTDNSSAVINHIMLLDIMGRRIDSQTSISEDDAAEFYLDISSRPAGLYFLIISTQKGEEVRKLEVE